MNNTNATVMVREHPAQSVFKEYIYENLREKLSIINQYGDRIYLASASDPINTYQYIEKCKVVLPYTSTMGVEAALMGKNVLIHTNVYYKDIGIGYKAYDRKDYFNAIVTCLEHPEKKICNNIENAYLAYYYQMNNVLNCQYCTHYTEWMEGSFIQLLKIKGVKKVTDAIAKGIAVIYSTVKEQLDNLNSDL